MHDESLTHDLRDRLIDAVDGGISCRAAVARLVLREGNRSSMLQDGDRRCQCIDFETGSIDWLREFGELADCLSKNNFGQMSRAMKTIYHELTEFTFTRKVFERWGIPDRLPGTSRE